MNSPGLLIKKTQAQQRLTNTSKRVTKIKIFPIGWSQSVCFSGKENENIAVNRLQRLFAPRTVRAVLCKYTV